MSVIGIQSSIWSNRFKTLVLLVLFPVLVFGVVFGLVYGFKLYEGDDIVKLYNQYEKYQKLLKEKEELEKEKEIINIKIKIENLKYGFSDKEGVYIKNSPLVINEFNYNKKRIDDINSKIIPLSKIDYPIEVKSSYEYNNSITPYKYYISTTHLEKSLDYTLEIFYFLGPVILIWALISFAFHRQIIFSFTEAHPITRKEYSEIYNIVENLCISRGLPVPNIGILEDDSMNAFAVGWNIKKSWIVFSRGIINRLNKTEIEAVAAHELTHIINKDGLLLVTIIVFIGAIAAIGEIMFRSGIRMGGGKSSDGKDSGQLKLILILVGIALLILGYLVLPLVQLAVSRKREYLADAGSVTLTKDKLSMISALQKISTDSTIESIKKDSVSALCINNPFPKTKGLTNWFHEFFSTHPSIENRVAVLEKY